MSYVIYNINTCKLWRENFADKIYASPGAAKGAYMKLLSKGKIDEGAWAVAEYKHWATVIDHYVDTTNLLTGQPCKIRASEKGGCCDPATETYHSM